jgi:hypothetical protein
MPLIKTLCAALLLQVNGIALACELPPLVVIPTKEDAVGQEEAIRAATAQYFEAMQGYTQCIQDELATAGGDAAPVITRAVLIKRNNLAVAEAEAVLKTFTANVGPIAQVGPSPEPPAAN